MHAFSVMVVKYAKVALASVARKFQLDFRADGALSTLRFGVASSEPRAVDTAIDHSSVCSSVLRCMQELQATTGPVLSVALNGRSAMPAGRESGSMLDRGK